MTAALPDSGNRSGSGQESPAERSLAHYELLETLGAGGMGIVYRARDTRLGRFVAIKVLPQDKAGHPRRKQRFIREAMLASGLNHPNIVTIHDISADQGRDFMVMELVEGRSLHDTIPADGLAYERALRYAIEIADAMSTAHAAGIVHRDLKPHNVMVCETDGTREQIKVLDFGVAKLNPAADPSPDGATLTALTERGETLGTLAYMSPEQLRSEPVDARSDIFSLGVVCYEMLTGRRPFHGTHPVDLAHEIYFTEPEPLRRWRPGLPVAIDTLITRTLQKQRGQRPSSMQELRQELERLLPPPDSGRLPKDEQATLFDLAFDRRPRRRTVAASLVLSGLVLALILALRQPVSQWINRQAATDRSSSATARATELSARDVYLQGLEQLEHYYRPGNIDRAIRSFQRVIARNPNSAAAYAGLAKTYLRKSLNEGRDRSWRDKALACARQAVALNGDLAAARASLGLVLVDLKELDEAHEHLQQALMLDPFHVDAYRGLGKLHETRGALDEAEAVFRRALEIRPEDRRLHDLLGGIYYRAGRYEEAEAAFLGSIELAPDASFGPRNLAAVYHMQGRFPEAADQLQRAIELRPTVGLYSNLGTLYFYQGLYQEALIAFRQTMEFKGSSQSYRRWANLADALRWTPDNAQEASDAYLRAIQLLRDDLASAPDNAAQHSRLALYLAKRGDRDPALQELARVEQLATKDAATHFRLAVTFELCEQREQALEALEAALLAGYSLAEIQREPELVDLRDDQRYHRLAIERFPT